LGAKNLHKAFIFTVVLVSIGLKPPWVCRVTRVVPVQWPPVDKHKLTDKKTIYVTSRSGLFIS